MYLTVFYLYIIILCTSNFTRWGNKELIQLFFLKEYKSFFRDNYQVKLPLLIVIFYYVNVF